MAKKEKMVVTSADVGKMPAAVTESTAPVDWSQYAGEPTGFENTTQEDLGIPFLLIVQKGSPEFDKTHKDYATKRIEGIDVGDIFNSLSREIVYKHAPDSDPLIFVPCGYIRQWVEWKPRGQGGGMVKAHRDPRIQNEVVSRDEANHDILRNGNLLVTTSYFFGLIVPMDEGVPPQQAIISMTATQLKKARFWLNLMAGIRLGPNRITPPMYSHRYAISTVPESNAKGSWFGWQIENDGIINTKQLIDEGISIAKKVQMANKLLLPAPDASQDVPM